MFCHSKYSVYYVIKCIFITQYPLNRKPAFDDIILTGVLISFNLIQQLAKGRLFRWTAISKKYLKQLFEPGHKKIKMAYSSKTNGLRSNMTNTRCPWQWYFSKRSLREQLADRCDPRAVRGGRRRGWGWCPVRAQGQGRGDRWPSALHQPQRARALPNPHTFTSRVRLLCHILMDLVFINHFFIITYDHVPQNIIMCHIWLCSDKDSNLIS